MDEIVFEFPARVAMEFARGDAADADVGGILVFFLLTPFKTTFGSETGDVFVILKISPKFYLGTRLFK